AQALPREKGGGALGRRKRERKQGPQPGCAKNEQIWAERRTAEGLLSRSEARPPRGEKPQFLTAAPSWFQRWIQGIARHLYRDLVQGLAGRDVERLAVRPTEGQVGDDVLRNGDAAEQFPLGTDHINAGRHVGGLAGATRRQDARGLPQVALGVQAHA